MTKRARLSRQAEADLEEQFIYYLVEGSEELAQRFFESIDATRALLLQHSEIGSLQEWLNPKLEGLRMFRVDGFENILIFYQATEYGVYVVRVLHGARDIAEELSGAS